MAAFRYKHGDRPLAGYTIERGAGRGGFGEVYYAVSDSGREVALKVINGYEQIELRGVSQCMNLKSPHLVTIFDVKHNEEQVPFVIMEFVSGPSLRQLLDESPAGLGTQKAAFFLREIGKGLSYLHECGIVHRDLKPGNIFYENGYVKIGDYGLSKAMSASPHSGQTITVGTVHYMAPEIGAGKYDRGIDIYAMGAVLFELLTGQVPYIGASPTEILMKHMTGEPDVSAIEEPFASAIRKAMARNPEERFQSIREMVEAVFGAEHIQQSVSVFSTDSLSMIAQRVAARAAVGVGAGSATPPPIGSPRKPTDVWETMGDAFGRLGNRIGAAGQRLGTHLAGQAALGEPSRDPLSTGQRTLLAGSVLALVSLATALFSGGHSSMPVGPMFILTLLGVAGGSAAITYFGGKVLVKMRHETDQMKRFALGGISATALLVCTIAFIVEARNDALIGRSILAALPALFFMNWPAVMAPGRAERLAFSHAFYAGLFGMIVSFLIGGNVTLSIGILAGMSLVVQLLCPWDPVEGRRTADRLELGEEEEPESWATSQARPQAPRPQALRPQFQPEGADSPAAPSLVPAALATGRSQVPTVYWPPVKPYTKYLWLALMTATITLGSAMLVIAGTQHVSRMDETLFICTGVSLIGLGALSLAWSFQRRFKGWFRYFFRPFGALVCAATILYSAVLIGNNNADPVLGTVFIVLPSILLVVLMSIGWSGPARDLPELIPVPPPAAIPGPEAIAVRPTDLPDAPPFAPPLPLAQFPATAQSPEPRHRPRRRHHGAGWTHAILALIGYAALIAAVAAGLMLAVDIPGFMAAGIADRTFPTYLERDFGTARWIRMVHLIGGIVYWGLLFGSITCLLMARRWAGIGHMLRAVFGILILAGGIATLDAGLEGKWTAIAGSGPNSVVAASIEAYLDKANARGAACAGALAIGGIIMLAWPKGRRPGTEERA